MDGALNITNPFVENFTEKYPEVSTIFPNKTIIVLGRKYSSSSSQMALLAGIAFIGGIVAGLLIRFIYFGVVKYFMSNVDQLVSSERPDRGNMNPSYIDDNFRNANDQPPDYVTVITESSTDSNLQQQRSCKFNEGTGNSEIYEELPPTYKTAVSDFSSLERSSSV